MATSLLSALRSGASILTGNAPFSTQATVSRRSRSWSSIRTSLRGAPPAPCRMACAHFFEGIVAGNAALDRHRFELRRAHDDARRIRIAAVAHAHQFGELAEATHAAHARNGLAIPHDAQRVASGLDAVMPRHEARTRLILGTTADADDDEFGGLEQCDAYHQDDDALIDG